MWSKCGAVSFYSDANACQEASVRGSSSSWAGAPKATDAQQRVLTSPLDSWGKGNTYTEQLPSLTQSPCLFLQNSRLRKADSTSLCSQKSWKIDFKMNLGCQEPSNSPWSGGWPWTSLPVLDAGVHGRCAVPRHLCSTRDLPQGCAGLPCTLPLARYPPTPAPALALAPVQFRCPWTSWSLLFLPNRAVSNGVLLWLFSSVTAWMYAGNARMLHMWRSREPLTLFLHCLSPWQAAMDHGGLPSPSVAIFLTDQKIWPQAASLYGFCPWNRFGTQFWRHTAFLHGLDCINIHWIVPKPSWFFCFVLISTCDLGTFYRKEIRKAHRQALCICGNLKKKLAGKQNDNYCRLGRSLRMGWGQRESWPGHAWVEISHWISFIYTTYWVI